MTAPPPQIMCEILKKIIEDLPQLYISIFQTHLRGWLRHCATIRKVAGLITDGIIEIFH